MMNQFPAWAAGSKATAAGLLQMEPFFAYKTADTSRSSTTSVTADPELSIALQPGTYLFDGWLNYQGAAIGTGDLKATFASGTGITVANFNIIGPTTGGITAANFALPAFGSAQALGTNGAGVSVAGQICGSVVITVANNLALFWAQNTSSGTATIIKAGSWLRAQQIA